MSVQIQCDPSALTDEQREAVAGFILAFPKRKPNLGTISGADVKVYADGKAIAGQVSALAEALVVGMPTERGVTAKHVPSEVERLAHDHASTLPGAFAILPDPNVQAAPAPSTAAAVPFAIVPEGTQVATSAPTPTVPVPPAPTPASVLAPAAPLPTSHATTVDRHGLPWDGRIHAPSKAFVADGSWRQKRNVDPALVTQVEAELRQLMSAAPSAVQTLAAQPWPIPETPAAVPVPPAPTVAADPRQQFVALIGRVSDAQGKGKVMQEEVTAICQKRGVPGITMLISRLDLLPEVAAEIDALLASRG